MRFKTKVKDCRLIIRAKASFGEAIDEKALDAFSRIYFRGFLRAQLIKKNQVEYSGPVGISLYERLKKPISKREFLFIMEQFVLAVQNITGSGLQLCNVVMDLHNVYINDITKEVQFMYVPMSKGSAMAETMSFIEGVVYSAIPANENDAEVLSRFIHFVKAQDALSPELIEKFIAKEDRSVVNTLKKNTSQSSFMTSKPKQYYDHLNGTAEENGEQSEVDGSKKGSTTGAQAAVNRAQVMSQETDADATSLLDEDATGVLDEDATGLLDEEATGLLQEDDDADEEVATGLLQEDDDADEEIATGLLQEDDDADEEVATGLLQEDDDADEEIATGLLQEDDDEAEEEIATGILADDTAQQSEEEAADDQETEGTMLLQEESTDSYPTLFRVLTEETVSVNKPVFRLGKERSYVDYFVSNNGAVSRSHADIITRGKKYFVIDLNSKNHTYINNEMIPVQCETEIRDGDMLKLGNEEFIFHAKTERDPNVCRNCGKNVEHMGNFCIYCGTRIER